ncbi:MAG: iron ABC transporter permease [Pseudomonadota bacterium]|nr:iron ABC transporter permease [Pseudomonadota bacterium]
MQGALLFISLAVLLISTMIFSLMQGAVALTPLQVLAILLHPFHLELSEPFSALHATVIWHIRLPRVILGILVGGGLALCGATLQGLFRNPLADPALLGVSNGAALAAVAVIVLLPTGIASLESSWMPYSIPLAAFAGGLITTALIYGLARSMGDSMMLATLLLAGLALNAFSGALMGLLTYLADDQQLRLLIFWSFGSLGRANWTQVGIASIIIGSVMIILPRYADSLNALLLGEAEAYHLGFAIERIKLILLVFIALTVGTSVAVAGVIGFVGLVVPHLLRLLIGPDHRRLLPATILLGASLLLAADGLARRVLAPAELPIGIVTALLGAPFFLGLLWQQRRHYGF